MDALPERVALAFILPVICLDQDVLTVRHDGFGPVSIGMSKSEVAHALGIKLAWDQVMPSEGTYACRYYRPAKGMASGR